MLPSIVIFPSLMEVSVPISASVILICFLVSVRMTFFSFFSSLGAAVGAAAGTAAPWLVLLIIVAAAVAAVTGTPANAGISRLRCSRFSTLPISICIMPFPPVLVCIADADISAAGSLTTSFAGVSSVSLILSSTSFVIGVNASTSVSSVEPSTCSMRSPSGLNVRRPASSMSSKSDGSSRSAALITSPFCLRQQKIAGSFKCFCKVSFVIDICLFPPLSMIFVTIDLITVQFL